MKTKKKAPIIRIKGFDGDWEQRKLGEVCQITMGQSPEGSTYSDEPSTYILVQGNADLKDGWVCPRVWTTQKTKTAEIGDLIMSVRAPAGTMGKTAYNVVLGRGVAGIKGNEFIYQTLVKMDADRYWKKLASGSTFESINSDAITNAEIKLPQNVEEQEKLGSYFSHLDALITLHQREIDRIVCLRKAMVEKMFPQNGADVPAVRFSRYKEPWRLCQFSEIFTERHIIDTISDEYPQLAFTIEEGVIRPEDKKTNKRDFLIIDKATKKYLQTEYDDIIYNPANVIYGAIHRNALGKGCVSPIYKIFYTDQDSTFMECIVRHPNFIKEISRSMEGTVKKLRTLKPKAFLEMSAYIAPTIEEQRQIGEYFRQMDRLIEIEKEELEKIKHIKSACLEKMFV